MTAPTRMPAIVRHRSKPHSPFARRSNHRARKLGTQPLSKCLFGLGDFHPPQIARRLNSDLLVVDHHDRRFRALADEDQGVATGAFPGDGKTTAGQRVVKLVGQRAFGNYGELGRGRQRTSHQRAEDEGDGRLRIVCIAGSGSLLQQQIRAQPATT